MKIRGKEVVMCWNCEFPDGEPIFHVGEGDNCKLTQQQLAENVTYSSCMDESEHPIHHLKDYEYCPGVGV